MYFHRMGLRHQLFLAHHLLFHWTQLARFHCHQPKSVQENQCPADRYFHWHRPIRIDLHHLWERWFPYSRDLQPSGSNRLQSVRNLRGSCCPSLSKNCNAGGLLSTPPHKKQQRHRSRLLPEYCPACRFYRCGRGPTACCCRRCRSQSRRCCGY